MHLAVIGGIVVATLSLIATIIDDDKKEKNTKIIEVEVEEKSDVTVL